MKGLQKKVPAPSKQQKIRAHKEKIFYQGLNQLKCESTQYELRYFTFFRLAGY